GWGTGFAFGASAEVSLDIDLWIAKLELDAGFGFDLAMKKYKNVVCSASGEQLGINGWYSTGQAYLYLNGRVELIGIELLEVSAGVLLQGGFPNPSWVSGQFKLKYKIIFEGDINAKVNIGHKCVPVGEEGSELPEVIYNIVPVSQSTQVDVMSSIDVDFNLPMNSTFTYEGSNGDIAYRTVVDSIELKSSFGFSIPLDTVYYADKTHLKLTPRYTLPSGDSLTFTIRAKVYKA